MGNRELLSHANLQLQRGRHYVLHGRNGIGKSTLLRAIATDQIPSIPRGVKVHLLGQTETTLEDDMEHIALEEETVLQSVVRSDKRRERLLHEAKILSSGLDTTADATAAARAYRQIIHERLHDELARTRQIAARRSGARGAKTKVTLIKAEEAVAVSERRLSSAIEADEMSAETQKAADMLSEVQTSLELVSLLLGALSSSN